MKIDETVRGLLWAALGVLFILLYTIPVFLFDLGSPLTFFGAKQLRAFVPALVICLVAADMLRSFLRGKDEEELVEEDENDDIAIPKVKPPEPGVVVGEAPEGREADRPVREEGVMAAGGEASGEATDGEALAEGEELEDDLFQPFGIGGALPNDVDGKTLFELARAIAHKEVPDFDHDREYLELLGDSALAGYAPAMAKLGEYAIRRRAWVEAYYWMIEARRHGMRGLSMPLRNIRMSWATSGFPTQISNTNRIYTEKAGSIGRALLHLDSGHEATHARSFLRKNYPEYLSRRGA